ncbi:MAG: hypothetical protein ACI9U2_001789 [Bradymonadia bacterium]|jgi:hypothetical protein
MSRSFLPHALVGATIIAGFASLGCASRNYTHYLIEPAPQKNPVLVEEEGTLVRPFGFGSTTVMKVRWNNGKMLTEVDIPMLASGQRIVIQHAETSGDVKTIPATTVVPPMPSLADKPLVEAYKARGLRVNPDPPDVSIAKSRTLMQQAMRNGNYQMGLEYCELVLARYPSHPEFMRAKGSILYLMGEREKAIEVYETVEEIESDPQVRKMLETLRKMDR